MQRVSLINGNNINYDFDHSTPFLAVLKEGVVKGLTLEPGKVTKGKALVKVSRVNGEEVLCVFELTEDLTIDTSGDKKIYIEINQENIDDGELNEENGTGIGEIKVGTNRPTKNYLKLARIESGAIISEKEEVKINGDLLQTQNLKGPPNSLIRFDENGNGEAIPEGQQGESLIIGANGKAGFGIAKVEMPYLSAKRELGEDIETKRIKQISLIPIMNSNNQDGWTLSSIHNNDDVWKAFNPSYSGWASYPHSQLPYILLESTTPYVFKTLYMEKGGILGKFEVLGSNDGSNRTSLGIYDVLNIAMSEFKLENNIAYKFLKINFLQKFPSSGYSINIYKIRLYGYTEGTTEEETDPKAYFIGEGSWINNIPETDIKTIGETTTKEFVGVVKPVCSYINNLKFNLEKIGNPGYTPKLKVYDIKYISLGTFSGPGITFYNNAYSIKINMGSNGSTYTYLTIKIDGVIYKQFERQPGFSTTEIISEYKPINKISVEITGSGASAISYKVTKAIPSLRLVDLNLIEGENNIVLDGDVFIQFDTYGEISSNNYWQVKTDNDILAGEYNIGFEKGKKYYSSSELSSRRKFDGIELNGGAKGEKTVGFEKGIFTIEGKEYGKLYIDKVGKLTSNETSLGGHNILVGIGNKIKIL